MRHPTLIVGGGSIGERHLRCFQQTGRADLRLCEPNEIRGRELAERYGVRWTPSFEEALREKPSLVILCTPAPMHVPMARQAVAAGCHVLIEKPLSVSTDGCRELIQEARDADRVIGVAYVWRMHPALRKAREILSSGLLGEPLHVLAICGQDFAALRPGYIQTYYASREQGGGAVQDGLTHVANAVEMLVGRTSSVCCEADHLAIPNVEVEDAAGAVARNGRSIAVYAFNQAQKPNEFVVDVHCTAGSLRIGLSGKRLGVFQNGEWKFEETPYPDHDALFTAQANSFLDAVARRESVSCTLEEGMHAIRFNLACLESAETGRRVTL